MISEVVMPQMGADMKEGVLLRWRKSEGDEVARGDVIAEIETDKADVEIEAYDAGIFRKALIPEGETVPVGTVIAIVAGAEEDISKYANGTAAPKSGATAPAPEAAPQAEAAPSAAPLEASEGRFGDAETPPATDAGRMRASPVARRVAEEAGIDLKTIEGTGPDGRIVKRDVEAAASATPSSPASPSRPAAPRGEDAVEAVGLSRMRQTIARRMQQSKQNAPHYYLTVEVDMTEAMRLRSQVNEALGDSGRASVNDLIVLATAKALVQHPKFNAYWQEDHLELHSQVNIGIAVALDDGLVVPAVLDCANKGLAEIAAAARDVAGRARSGGLSPEEYSASTFTISNLGAFGVDVLVAIINPPQVGILGVGAVREMPVVRDGQVVVRQMMSVVLSGDHRATDGAEGARFLETIKRNLETPLLMLV